MNKVRNSAPLILCPDDSACGTRKLFCPRLGKTALPLDRCGLTLYSFYLLAISCGHQGNNVSLVISSRGLRLPARKIIASPLTKSKSLVQVTFAWEYISYHCTKKKIQPRALILKSMKENNTQNKQTSQPSPAWAK